MASITESLLHMTFHQFVKLCCLFLAMLSQACQTDSSKINGAINLRFSNRTVDHLDSFITDLHRTLPLPGLAIAVIQNDSVYFKTVGHGDLKNNTPLTDSTLFFVGNLSELIVATILLRMEDAGEINLDDPVVMHLPHFELGGNDEDIITIRNLLTHTSGIPHHDASWDLPDSSAHALEATTRSIADQLPLFAPGSQVKRSPYNYDILADLISHVTKKQFESASSAYLPKPAFMNSSSFMPALSDSASKLAQPHRIDDWMLYTMTTQDRYPYNREHAGSIGFHSTIKDMAAWIGMLLRADDRLLNKEQNNEFFKPQFKTSENNYVGLGWEINRSNEKYTYHKTHQIGGFSADITLIPDTGTGILVLANIADDFNPSAVSMQLDAYLHHRRTLIVKTPVHLAMTCTLASTGNLDSALELYSRLKRNHLEDYDFDEETLSQLGVNLLYRLKEIEKAKKVFQFCIAQFPNSSAAYLNLAEAHLMSNDLAQVEQSINAAKKLHPNIIIQSRLQYIEEMLEIKKEKSPSFTPTKP
jgi:CubicO group peptidase (beta-lactamase class C family)